MPPSRFHAWLAETLGQPVSEVSHLLSQEMAVEFLMSWSLFESRCFEGFMKLHLIEPYVRRTIDQENFDVSVLTDHFTHFHDRYQDPEKRRSLFHQQKSERFGEVVRSTKANATPYDTAFLCTAVAYRFRNNMFHGSKGVRTWLKYREQIDRCSAILQALTSHAESQSRQIAIPLAHKSAA